MLLCMQITHSKTKQKELTLINTYGTETKLWARIKLSVTFHRGYFESIYIFSM